MLKFATPICAAAALFTLSACASDGNYSGGVAYNAYYDDFYGPFYDGYWGPDGVFFFSEGVGRPFRRDEEHHFRREAAEGFHGVTPRVASRAAPANPRPPAPYSVGPARPNG